MFETAPVLPLPSAPVSPEPSASGNSATPAPGTAVLLEPLADQLTPSDLTRRPRLWGRLAWYGGAMLLTCLLTFTGLRLDRADLKAPFYYDLDSLLILPMVKATIERGPGGHWRNERLGAPGTMELHDFPVIDHLHFGLIWVLSKFVSNVILVYNLYFLLTFPLTTLTAMIVFRYLGLTLPAAAVGGLLYAFLPFHYQRWENHYFLSAYWMVPLSLLPAFAICRGNLPFFLRLTNGTYQLHLVSWKSFGYIVLAAAVASAGAYYAFFACAIIAFAGLYGWVGFRTWRAVASAGAVVVVIFAVGVANHYPTFRYQWEYGKNPVTDRGPEEADIYGLKIAHLVLPIADHNLRVLAHVREKYFVPTRPCEGENAGSLGIIGVAGLMGLTAVVLLPYRRRWPYGPLAALTLFTIFLASIGGFGSLFNLYVTASIRGYNRASVFIAFLCLAAALWAIDLFLLSRKGPRASRIRFACWAAILLIGFLDQTPYAWFKSEITKTLNDQANRFHADARFFAEVERTMPVGTKVFCLPYVPFPEHPPIERMPVYEHARGYIHTDTLVWSFGAIKWREHDAWQWNVAFDKPDELLRRIVFRGFDGLFIDSRGFSTTKDGNRASILIQDLNATYAQLANQRNARLPQITHEDGLQFFLDLRPYRELLKKDPAYYEGGVKREQEWVTAIWLDGFMSPEPPGYYDLLRYGPPKARAVVINPSDRTRKFLMRFRFGVDSPGPFQLQLSGLVNDELPLDKKPTEFGTSVIRHIEPRDYIVEVPPGRHAIHFRCTPPAHYIPADHRNLCFYILQFEMKEIP